jgi:pimeloyl-ACP methyl ester carboxylesterase
VGDLVLRALNGLDTRSILSEVKHPTRVLHGEHDQLLPMADSKHLASIMKSADFSIVQGQGHCSNVENPQKFVEIADRFLFES